MKTSERTKQKIERAAAKAGELARDAKKLVDDLLPLLRIIKRVR